MGAVFVLGGVMASLRVIVLGIVGGLIGDLSRFPAGALLGALSAVAIVNVVTDGKLTVHPRLRIPSRVLIGASIGSMATPALLRTLGASVGWTIAATVLVLVLSLSLGLLFAWVAKVDRRTALLGCCPGGIAEMAVLAKDSGADVEIVLGLHVVRKIAVLVSVVVFVVLL